MNYLSKPALVRYSFVTDGHERTWTDGITPASRLGSAGVDLWQINLSSLTKPPTYAMLLERVTEKARAASDGALSPSHKNACTRLRKAVAALGLEMSSTAHAMCGEVAATEAINKLRNSAFKTAQERSDVVSAYRWWCARSAEHYPAASAAAEAQPHRLVKQKTLKWMLRHAYNRQNKSLREIAKAAEISLSSLTRWLAGSLPDEQSIDGLRRLAVVLRLDIEQVLGCISHRHIERVAKAATDYGRFLQERHKPENRYLIVDGDVTHQLVEQWTGFVHSQTTSFPTEPRPTERGWRLRENTTEAERGRWFATVADSYSPTAEVNWRRILAYLSFIANVGPIEKPDHLRSPRGIEAVQTLGWLAVPQYIDFYFQWHRECAGGYNNGARALFGIAHSLCARETGWLRRRPEIADTLPPDVRPADWSASCDAVVRFTAMMTVKDKSGMPSSLAVARDAFSGLQYYLAFDDPMAPIVRAIRNLQLEAQGLDSDSRCRAVRLRDAAILALLLMLPVRLTTASSLEWGKHLSIQDGRLMVHIPAALLKNGRVMGPLKTTLDGELVPVIARYIDEARTVLQGQVETRFMFLFERGNHQAPWRGISTRCVEVTTRFCAGHAIPEQSIRHLVASRYLRLNPGDYVGVAALLWDTLQTVLRHYAPRDPTGAISRNAQSISMSMPMTKHGNSDRGAARQ